jgi:serine/threonine protein kinase/CheY-like chemotaxis protein
MSEPRDREAAAPSSSKGSDKTTRLGPRSSKRPPMRRCPQCGKGPRPEGGPCPHCGARDPDDRTVVDAAPPLGTGAAVELGTTVDGRYRVESELGRGGMGVVYLASDMWLDRQVALKMIAPTWARDGEIVASFLREAKALASIRSPYVVQVYAFGFHEGARFFAMEYVRGRSVKEILVEHKKHGDTIPVHRTLTILNRIAQGIDAVHAAGILHRDVKPANIVIEEETGRPVLVDFGLAVPGDDPARALAIGTPQYMAPEQGGVGVPGSSVTARIDIYALGVTAFELLTGELPFDTSDRARLMRLHARKQAPLLSSKRPELAAFDKTIARALAKDPADRYPSCTAFAEVLAAASDRWVNSTLPTLPPPPGGGPPSKPPSTSRRPPASRPTVPDKPLLDVPAAPRAPMGLPAVPAGGAGAQAATAPVGGAGAQPATAPAPVGGAGAQAGTAPVGASGQGVTGAVGGPPQTPPLGIAAVPAATPPLGQAPVRGQIPPPFPGVRRPTPPVGTTGLAGKTPSSPHPVFSPQGISAAKPISSPHPLSQTAMGAQPAGGATAQTSQVTQTGGRVFHVLVVDDSPLFRKQTVQAAQIAFFRRKNHAVAVRGAASGQEALRLAAAYPPDLVLLDFDMPGLDGVGTLSQLRELPGGHGARVVVLSGRVSAADKWRFSVLGVGDFVTKPIEMRALVERIEGIARRFEEAQRTRTAPAG